jgi:hypothetical protein
MTEAAVEHSKAADFLTARGFRFPDKIVEHQVFQ